jgi:hypothetical protein
MKLPFCFFVPVLRSCASVPVHLVCCVIVVSWNDFPINPFLWDFSPHLAQDPCETQHFVAQIPEFLADAAARARHTTRY